MSLEGVAIVLHHSRAKGTDKLVLIGIANHAGDGGAWPAVSTLATYANVDARSVQRSLRRLEALGELTTVRQGGGLAAYDDVRRPNLYVLRVACPPDCDRTMNHRTRRRTGPQLTLLPVDSSVRGDTDVTPPGDTDVTPPGDAGVTQTIHLNQPQNTSSSTGTRTTGRSCGQRDCLDGWLGVDDEDRPIVCPVCRPAADRRLNHHRQEL